tara:strand:+ start:3266 stop:3940 length:675 start_codon:yes stop_codon:yes gene_type:complete
MNEKSLITTIDYITNIHKDSLKPLKFIHITKCSGSFIEELGRKYKLKWGRFDKDYKAFWHNLPGKIVREKYDYFMLVRNPYNRVLSEYYDKWAGKGYTYNHNKHQFNSFLINKLNKSQEVSKRHHFAKQSLYISEDIKPYIIKVENMYEMLPILFSKYNLNIDMNSLKPTNIRSQQNKSSSKKKGFTINDFNDILINTINHVYKTDFELFSYDMIDTKKLDSDN